MSDVITTGQDPDEGTKPWYRRMYDACEVDPGRESVLAGSVAAVLRGKPQYLSLARRLAVPHQYQQNVGLFFGCIHWKEASCDFRAVLHNGERIIGTGRKTTLVPTGRGPFSTWESAAVDAIVMNRSRWKTLLAGTYDIAEYLYPAERYNGTGYISGAGKAENAPYLWACSNINDDYGKYTSDHGFDPKATVQKTAGLALILKELERLGEFKRAA